MDESEAYRRVVLEKISTFKKNSFGTYVVPCILGDSRYDLVLLTADTSKNSQILSFLAVWRKQHERWFPAQFPVTQKGTKKWFQERVTGAPDRILFIISAGGSYIGHVGLNRFDFKTRSCEIDNIVRGSSLYPGIMENAIANMMSWGRRVLGLAHYRLETTSHNSRALNLYKKLGFIEVKRVPIVKVKRSDRTEWVALADTRKIPKRYTIFMEQTGPIDPHKKISFAGPWITQKEIDYVVDGVNDGFYQTFDKHIRKLEKTTASYVGTKYALAGFCATHSLHLACLVCGFTKGDEVIVTDFSWAATAHVIAYTGAIPAFVDIDPDTWCIDPAAIERAITKKTKGIMLVHSFGMPAEMDAIMLIARRHNLKVIEDAAPALGSLYKGKKVGGFGDIGCISFHGAKIAASGEGGMFLTNSKHMLDEAVLLSNMGRTNRVANFWCDVLGYEYQMANVTAALALAQVERIEELVAAKRRIFDWYFERLKNIPELKMLKEKPDSRSNYAYPAVLLRTKKISRDDVVRRLREYNIHAREAFPRMSGFPMYHRRFSNPEAARVEKYGFNLPSALNLDEKDIEFVCDSLLSIMRNQ